MAAMSAQQLIQHLESRGLLPADLIRELRDSAAKTPDVSARQLVRWLVSNGHLSRFQGEELLSRSEPSPKPWEAPAAGEGGPRSSGRQPAKGRGSEKPASKPADDLQVDDLDVIDDNVIDDLEEIGPGDLTPVPPMTGGGPPSLDSLMHAANMPAQNLGPAMNPGGMLGMPGTGKKQKPPANPWDNKLILIGGGSLVLLVLIGVALAFSLNRRTGDEALQAGEEAYSNGQYGEAIAQYDVFLDKSPKHPKVSQGRVHRAVCLMRRLVEGAKGEAWMRAFEEVKPIIDSVLTEEALPDSRAEIAAALHSIVDGLAEHAESHVDGAAVKLCREAIELTRDPQYVPAKNRDEQRLVRAEVRLARVDRDLDRGRRLQVAIDAIKQEVDKQDVAAAYKIRKALVRDYPDMASNPDLQAAIQWASLKEQELVKFVAEEKAAETKDVERPIKTTLLPSTTLKASPAGMAGQIVCALAEGAAYALDAATGKVLWRRFVGYDTLVAPTRVGPQSGGDVLLVDSQNGELVRVAGATGQLRWRLALPGLKVAPAVVGNQLWVPGGEGAKGRLYIVELETGKSTGYVELPQPVRSSATADADGKLVFQVSEHSNLYVLDVATRTCKMVFYLGHEAGTIVAPPVLAGDYVILTENRQAKVAWVRVLKREENEEGQQSLRQLQEVRVDGHMAVPPLVIGRNLIVATDLGGVFMFDISPTNPKEPLIKGPLKAAALSKRRTTYVHMRGSRLWVGNSQFASYDVQLAGGQLLARWIADENSEFLQPFQTAGDVIFHVRAQTGKPGVVVTAAQMDEREIYWETRLAAPPAGGAIVDPKRGELSLLLADGSLFQTPLAALAAAQGLPAAVSSLRVDPPGPEVQAVAISESRWAFVSPEERSRVLAYAPHEAGPILRWVKLPDVAGGLPVALAGKLVVPGAAGVVFSFDPFSGQFGPAPFLPGVDGGREFHWRVNDTAGQSDILLFDGRPKKSRLFRLGVRNEPSEHLGALSQVDTSQQLASSIARTEKMAYAVNTAGELVAFELPGLRQKWSSKLFAQVAWGPRTVGSRTMLLVEPQPYDEVHLKSGEVLKVQPITAKLPEQPKPDAKLTVRLQDFPEPAAAPPKASTAKPMAAKMPSAPGEVAKEPKAKNSAPQSKEKSLPPGTRIIAWGDIDHLKRFDEIYAESAPQRLICLDDASNRPVWSIAWRYGALAGSPLATKEGGCLASSASGSVVRLGPAGEEVAKVDLRQPLASGPIALDDRQTAVAGRDGTLHVLTTP